MLVEGWHMEEEEDKVEEGKENGIGKVEQGNKETGGKKEELGRIPPSVPRYLIVGSLTKNPFWENVLEPNYTYSK